MLATGGTLPENAQVTLLTEEWLQVSVLLLGNALLDVL